MIGFSIGFGCIPFLLLGELFPAEQRSILSSIAGSFNLGVMFIVIKTYHYLESVCILLVLVLLFCKFTQIEWCEFFVYFFHSNFFHLLFYSEQIITTAGTFWMYSVFCALAVIFVISVVPETKGRDLDDIAKLFVKNRGSSVQSRSTNAKKQMAIANVVSETNGGVHNLSFNGTSEHDSEITKL